MTVALNSVLLHTLRLPLVSPFTTSRGTETDKLVVIVAAEADVDGVAVTGWGECVAEEAPTYASEHVRGVLAVCTQFLLPRLFEAQRHGELTAETVSDHLAMYSGHRMAKAALEMAVLDAQLRGQRRSFAEYLGVLADRVPSGVSVGIQDSVADLLAAVRGYLDQGYQRIKLKIQPGWDLEPVRAVRREFGDVPLQVDANTAYTLADAPLLRRLDEFDLLLIEQPLGADDLRQHAALAATLRTPICLDESIVSAAGAFDAIALGATTVINVKPGRVGGYLEARRIHDVCRAAGVAVWCGGMVETGIGRAANAALAGLSGFTLIGDISGSARFFAVDLTPPVVMRDGWVPIRSGPGLCDEPLPERLAEFRVDVCEASPG